MTSLWWKILKVRSSNETVAEPSTVAPESRTSMRIPARPCRRRIAKLFASALLLMCVPTQAQEPQVGFKVSANLILVDVRIVDADGRPVMGLTRDDFTLLEEGQVQTIDHFQEISLPLTSSRVEVDRPDQPPRSPSPASETDQVMAPDKRLLILFFNFSSADLQDAEMMKKAAHEFLQEQFDPSDSVAVLAFDNGLEMITDFTSDRIILSQAIGRLSSGEQGLDVSLPEDDSAEAASDGGFIADETEFALFETNQQLSAIEAVADAFRDVSGRKALIYFSSGFSSRGIENDDQMRWTTDLCNRSNISIYAVDSRGLVALSPGGGAHRGGGRGTGIYTGRADLNQMASLVQSRETLYALAADTGGASLMDDNDLSQIFRKAREDSSHYYLIGYYTPAPPADGRFRKVEVRTRISYPSVAYRRGYYADKPYRNLTPPEREFKLLQTVMDDASVSDFPLEISAEYFPDSSGRYQIPILLAFNHRQLKVLSGADALNLEVIMLARDPLEQTQGGVRDTVEIRPQKGKKSDTRFVYQNLLVLDPGEYQLTAFIRDNRTGLMSRAVRALKLPPLGSFRPSSLVLAGGWKEPDSQSGYRIKKGKHVTIVQNPLEIRDRVLIPRVNGKFTRLETLYLHGKIAVQKAQSGSYRILLLNHKGERIFEGQWTSFTPDNTTPADINARLPLDQLPHGDYRMVLEVRLEDEETHLLVREFAVVPAGV